MIRATISLDKTYNLAGTLDGLALLDLSVGTEKHNTDLAGFQVHAHALDAGGEPLHTLVLPQRSLDGANCGDVLDKLLSLDIVHAVHTRDTVTVPPSVHCSVPIMSN